MISAAPIKPIFDSLLRSVRKTSAVFMKSEAERLAKEIMKVFPMQGKRGGNPKWIPTGWTGLTLRATWPWNKGIRAKKSYAKSARALYDTGQLSQSIQRLSPRVSQDGITEYITSVMPYRNLDKIETGGEVTAISRNPNRKRVKLKLPARPFLYVTGEDAKKFILGISNLDFSKDWK